MYYLYLPVVSKLAVCTMRLETLLLVLRLRLALDPVRSGGLFAVQRLLWSLFSIRVMEAEGMKACIVHV
jgi:hypothetical protein